MIKKRNQLITMIPTPTMDLKGLNGVVSGADFGLHFGAAILDFGSLTFDFKGFGPNISGLAQFRGAARPKGNLPIA